MKRFGFSFILFTGLLFTFTQCGSADAGAKFANEFFTKLIASDFEKAAEMVELPLGDTTDLIAQLQVMQNNPVNGKLKSFEKSMGFKTNINNGVKTVELPYVLTYEKGTQAFTVVIVNKGAGDKIVSVR